MLAVNAKRSFSLIHMKHLHSETFDNSLVLLTEHNEKILISALMMRKCSMGHL
jgi:putative AlgH/UPF0301 family transcriptional regulator